MVFPELALTTLLPPLVGRGPGRGGPWFETEMPGPATKALFDEAAQLGVGFCLGLRRS